MTVQANIWIPSSIIATAADIATAAAHVRLTIGILQIFLSFIVRAGVI